MDFEKAFQHVKDGTATQEEMNYVDSEVMRVQEIYRRTGKMPKGEPGKITPESIAEECRKGAVRKLIFAIVAIVLSIALVAFLIIRNTYSNAERNSNISEEKAIELATDAAAEASGEDMSTYKVVSVEREMTNGQSSEESYYVYEIEFSNGMTEIDVNVNANTSQTKVTEIDRD